VSKSLQDQLLKAGLVDTKKAKKVKQQKRKQAKQERKGLAEPEVESSRSQAEQALQEKAQRDRELNQQRNAEAEKKALQAQIKQLIELNRLPREGDVAFNFVDAGKVKKLHVKAQVQEQLSRGRLAIVKLGEQYEVVPMPVAEKIALRDDTVVVVSHDKEPLQDDEDDYYADYKIPDDLMW